MSLEQFTWSQYLAAMGLLLAAYYLLIAVIYYRQEARRLLSGKRRQKSDSDLPIKKDNDIQDQDEEQEDMEEVSEANEQVAELEALALEIREGILEKAGKRISKAVLLDMLKAKLSNYDGLHRPAFQYALNNFIIENAKAICGVAFSEEELKAAWRTLPR